MENFSQEVKDAMNEVTIISLFYKSDNYLQDDIFDAV